MPKKFVFLPPPFPAVNEWKAMLEEAVDGIDVTVCESREQALTVLPDAHAAFGALDPELLGCAANLQWLACPFAGPKPSFYFPELVASDVTVTNARGVYEDHIAVHIMAFILAFARNLHVYLPNQLRGEWDSLGEQGPAIYLPRATALIVGVGSICAEAARHCAFYGMRVIGVDPRVSVTTEGMSAIYPAEALDDHIGDADFVIITAPQTPQTQRMMDMARMRKMRSTAILINIGRGASVVLDDLAQALEEGVIGGAALDVFEEEPLPATHPLWKAPNFLMTPHVAAAGGFLEERRRTLLADNCRRFFAGDELVNIVDKANWF